jgi:hypothetical protein
MKYLVNITKDKIVEVKKALSKTGIRESARQTNVSYYTAWCISQGKYDNDEPLQSTNSWNRCLITGIKLQDLK